MLKRYATIVGLSMSILHLAPAAARAEPGADDLRASRLCAASARLARTLSMLEERGADTQTARLVIEPARTVDERLYEALADTVDGIYGGNSKMMALARDGDWAGFCIGYLRPASRA